MERIYIISPIIGAIIGYITNWVAIKMLFRPLKKVYIGPVPLPFTPGLIPKERKRIARSIADAIGENLLNPEHLAKEAVSMDKLMLIESFIDKRLSEFKNSEITIYGVLERFGDVDVGISKAVSALTQKITSPEFVNLYIDKLTMFVTNGLEGYFKDNSEIKKKIKDVLLDKFSSEERSLKEILPEEILNSIPSWSSKLSQGIAASIEDYIAKPSTEQLIKKHIDDYLKKGPMRNLLGMFLDTSLIAKQATSAVVNFVKDPENETHIKSVIESKINELLLKTPKEVLQLIGEENLQTVLDQGTNLLFSRKTFESLLSKEHLLALICSDHTREKLENALFTISNQIKEVKLNKIYNLFGDKGWQELKKKAIDLYREKAPALLVAVFTEFNLTNIIEEKINAFDLLELENLIFGISKKELGAITWLGGLLGFFMGLLTPLINAILL